jgi:hypothetical protein
MKTFWRLSFILSVAFLSPALVRAQGTLQFHVEMGGPRDDLSLSYAEGTFLLDGRIFTGSLGTRGGSDWRITDAQGSVIFTPWYESAVLGGPNYSGYFSDSIGWSNGPLTDSQIAQLTSGNWYATMSTPGLPFSPGGQMSGQLQLVSEPPAFAFFGVGLVAVVTFCRKGRKTLF